MAKGTVKWFNNAKGYGFVIPDSGEVDLFVHYSYILADGYRTLKAGQRVEYDVQEAPKGLHAINIRMMEGDIVPILDHPSNTVLLQDNVQSSIELTTGVETVETESSNKTENTSSVEAI